MNNMSVLAEYYGRAMIYTGKLEPMLMEQERNKQKSWSQHEGFFFKLQIYPTPTLYSFTTL